eukprot:TRINITY_DN16316_c0_g1_i1.p1 TRINITY_DN16316_c0_g1~~TRINITY_DN16316_c0_g1_i1.p1  ORF type:complete len:1621 (-),score=384.37 TRINITY_DN16316_c0_g1_i1:116-4978(-)
MVVAGVRAGRRAYKVVSHTGDPELGTWEAKIVPLLQTEEAASPDSPSGRYNVIQAAWQLENAIFGQKLGKYPEEIAAAWEEHFAIQNFNRWYCRALVGLIILTFIEVPTWCHVQSEGMSNWTFYEGSEWCQVPDHGHEESDAFLSGLTYLPPGYALVVEVIIEIIILKKFVMDYNFEMKRFAPIGEKYKNLRIIFWGCIFAVGGILDTAVFTLIKLPIRLTFIFRTGLIFLLPGVQSLFTSIFNKKMFSEFMSISVFLWGTMGFFAWTAVTIFKDINQVSYVTEEGEAVLVNKDLDTLTGAFYSMFVAAVTGEFVDVFLPSFTAYRTVGFMWLTFLVLAKILFENLTLDTLVSAYINGADEERCKLTEINASGMISAFNSLVAASQGDPADPKISKEIFMDFIDVLGQSPRMCAVPPKVADMIWDNNNGEITTKNWCEICNLVTSSLQVCPNYPEYSVQKYWWGRLLRKAVWEPKEQPAFDNLMNNILLVNLVLVLIESAYNLNDWGAAPAWTDYLELIFSFVYVGEVACKLAVKSWEEYWASPANRFDYGTTWLLLCSSLLPYLPVALLPFDVKRYANILRLLRLLRVVKQLKSLSSVQFLVSTVTKMVGAAQDILALLGTVVFFFTCLSVQLYGGVMYKGAPGLDETEYKEKQWYVFNFNDMPMAFGVWFTQLLCEYVPTNAEALQKTSKFGSVAWLIFPFFYFISVAIMFEILLAFTVEAYVQLGEEAEMEEEPEEESESESEEEEEEGHGHGEAHGEGHGHGEAHGEGHGHGEGSQSGSSESEEEFVVSDFLDECQDDFDKEGACIHYMTQDEPNFPEMLREAYEEVIEEGKKKRKHKAEEIEEFEHSHVQIAKAAWQLENAICHTEWEQYPEDVVSARAAHFRLLRANKQYYRAIVALVILTIWEVPPWCHEKHGDAGSVWAWMPGTEWCQVPDHDGIKSDANLSGMWYLPPGPALLVEFIIEFTILRKFVLEYLLEAKHFMPIGAEYADQQSIMFGLIFSCGSILDTLFFTYARLPMRFTWLFRTGLLFILPGVQRIFKCIFNKQMLGEFCSVAVFFIGAVMFFAWVAVTIFKDLNEVAMDFGEEKVMANKGLDTLSAATYSLFVSGIGEGFVDNLLPSYSKYRSSGLLWLCFLLIAQTLLLNLVIDAFVAAYLKGSEAEMDRKAETMAMSVYKAYRTLATGQEGGVPKELFLEFVADLGQSPRMPTLDPHVVEVIFDRFGTVDEDNFLDICRVIQNRIWTAPKNSSLETSYEEIWNHPVFELVKQAVWEPKELPLFDKFMNNVLLANMFLVFAQSAYNLNNWGSLPHWMKTVDFLFSFIYVGEVSIKLSVKSWEEYWSFGANQFDFVTTWVLLGTTLLPYLPFASVQSDLKHYATILRLLRLVRVVKQLKQWKGVQFMISVVNRMVNGAGDILQMLGVTLFFFSTLAVNLFGGVLYQGKPELEGTEYAKKNWYVFNFNDMPMAFVTWFAQLLSEYVPENAAALQVACTWGSVAWYIFPAFYVLGVAIIFEIAKAFTIEYYLAIKEECEEEEGEGEEEEEPAEVRVEGAAQALALQAIEQSLADDGESFHYSIRCESWIGQHQLKQAYMEHIEAMHGGGHGGGHGEEKEEKHGH